MPCTRCNGVVMKEHFYDMVDDSGVFRLKAWRRASRCVQCGNVVADRVMDTASVLSPHDINRPSDRQSSKPAFTMF